MTERFNSGVQKQGDTLGQTLSEYHNADRARYQGNA